MSKLIFDIETIGENYNELDETTQKVLAGWAKGGDNDDYEKELAEIKDGLGLSPLTGRIVSIAVMDYEKEKGTVYFQAPGEEAEGEFEEGNFRFKPMGEKEMLEHFWDGASHYSEFITFNGRGFDVPYLIIRSAAHGIKPSKDLMSNRYLSMQKFGANHIDLYDQLTFYGATRRRGGLHLYCHAFGIKSPKSDGLDGNEVGRLFQEGRFKDIARYNSTDVVATRDLYDVWAQFIKI